VNVIVSLQEHADSKLHTMVNADRTDWQVHQTLFFCQFLYGLLSAPFVPFQIPIVRSVITHAVPTAYNADGHCVKLIGPRKRSDEEHVHTLWEKFFDTANGRSKKEVEQPTSNGSLKFQDVKSHHLLEDIYAVIHGRPVSSV